MAAGHIHMDIFHKLYVNEEHTFYSSNFQSIQLWIKNIPGPVKQHILFDMTVNLMVNTKL